MGVELHDNRGLICGFHLQSQGPAIAIEIGAVSAIEPPAGALWLHFNLNDGRARTWIGACAWLPAEGRERLLGSERSALLEVWGTAITGALADVYSDDPERFGLVYVYVDQNCLISGRRHPVTAAALLHADLAAGLPIDTTPALFNRLFTHLVATRTKAVAEFVAVIDQAEDRVFAGAYHAVRLGQHRGGMARLRRQLVADRNACVDFFAHPPAWWPKPATKNLRRLGGALTSAVQDLELTEDRARLINEEIDSRQIERTNRNLYFVSMAAAVFLPMTVISGIFGMNVGGLPWVDDASGFRWVMACMAAAVTLALALLAWRRML
ncbi:putative Mg2+/Co2+ transporter [uncultured Defluviicoccus sp.]|uniref:Putative Mg2+/Co2+ transporter n=1 Tax=metagenome TaxID=256318 RepID=A0A380TIG6_9ZZZZ|nr:putative Mg2+/Co2+ transporter [uncultured Defluviicoccus sp.]